VGLFQFAVFILIGALSLLFGDKKVDLGGMVVDFSTLPVDVVIYAVIYFVLGYLLYATLAAMLGSLVSSMEEIQTMMMPLTMVVVVAFMISMFGLTTPDALYVVVSSYIPLFTPLVMFLRVGLSNPACWEVLITTVLLIGSILLSAYVAAKVYRGGVLMYGKASFAGILKAMKLYKEK
ncbi:MAG: ABC transporter permease, partial [Thermicanus sp.]|nr:ABC transporter permease [Thermicanus sp.]